MAGKKLGKIFSRRSPAAKPRRPRKPKNIRAQIKRAQVFGKIARQRRPTTTLPPSAQTALNQEPGKGRIAKKLKKAGRGRLA